MMNKPFKICATAAASVLLLLVVRRLSMDTQKTQLPLPLLPLTEVKERLDQKPFSSKKINQSTLATDYTQQGGGSDHIAIKEMVSANEEKRIQTTKQERTDWKMVNSSAQTQIFSAYIDVRDKQPKVIILGLQDHTQAQLLHYYCVVKYHNETEVCLKEPAIQTVINRGDEKTGKIVWAYSFTCEMNFYSREMDNRLFIRLSMDKTCPSNETSWLPISTKHLDNRNLKLFGVCIETPLFRNIHTEMPIELVIEGIERNRALGADWITVYVQDTTEDIMKVLEDYEKEGILEIVNWNLSKEAIQHSH